MLFIPSFMLSLFEGLASLKNETSYGEKVIECCIVVVVFMGYFGRVVAVWMD